MVGTLRFAIVWSCSSCQAPRTTQLQALAYGRFSVVLVHQSFFQYSEYPSLVLLDQDISSQLDSAQLVLVVRHS